MEAIKALLSGLTAGGWIAVVILIIVILFGGFLCMTGGAVPSENKNPEAGRYVYGKSSKI